MCLGVCSRCLWRFEFDRHSDWVVFFFFGLKHGIVSGFELHAR